MAEEVQGLAKHNGVEQCDPRIGLAGGVSLLDVMTEAFLLDSIDQRLQSFVDWYGEIPLEAKRLEEHEARSHATPWLRHHLGRGIVAGYVIGYGLGERWWTFFFERASGSGTGGVEHWWVEAYDYNGGSWSRNYYYSTGDSRWQPG